MSAHNELTKNRWTYFGVAVILILAFLFFVLAWHLKNNGAGNEAELQVTLQADGETKQTLEFSSPSLVPGGSAEYLLRVRAEEAGSYTLRLDFAEENAGVLKDFITVEAELNGEKIGEYTLAGLFAGEKISFKHDFTEETTANVTIRYVLSKDATDETQGASADFDVILTGSKG